MTSPIALVERVVHDHGHVVAARALDEVVLDLRGSAGASRGTSRAGAGPRSSSRGPRSGCGGGSRPRSRSTHWTTNAPGNRRPTIPGTRWTPSSTVDHRSVAARSSAAWTPTTTFRVWSRKPRIAASPDSSSSALREREPRLEARVVDGRHELLREERAHRLADEVGRRDACDAEAVRGLRRDGRLPGARGAADEQQQRLVETLAAHRADGVAGRSVAASSSPITSAASSPSRSMSREIAPRSARSRSARRAIEIRALRIEPGDRQRPRHEPLRERNFVAQGQRNGVPALPHTRIPAISSSISSRSGSPGAGDGSFAASTTSTPRAERVLGDDVDRGRLELDEEDVGVDARELGSRALRGRRDSRRRGRPPLRTRPRGVSRGARAPPQARCRSTRPSAARRLARAGAQHRRDDVDAVRHDRADGVAHALASREPSSAIVTTTRSARRSRYSFRYPVATAGSWCPPTTTTVRSVAIGGSAAPLPSKTTRSGPSCRRDAGAFGDVGASRRPRRGHRRTAGSRRSRLRRAPRSRDDRTPHAVPPARARRAHSTVGGTTTISGSAGPPRPIATTTTRRSARASRARRPVTAVFPTRFPVPTTATDGTSNGSTRGGSNRKSAPT